MVRLRELEGVYADPALLGPAGFLAPPPPIDPELRSGEGRLLVFALDEVKELPSGGRGVMAIKLHEGEAMLGIRPVAGTLSIAAFGRGDARKTLEVDAGGLEHYRGARARTGRVLQGSFKRVEGFQ
jgi:topoisomerase-4 subunit A